MSDAWDAAKSKGADIAEDAVDAVRSRPLTATGVVAAIALFLAREPLIDLAGKLVDGAKRKRQTQKPQGQERNRTRRRQSNDRRQKRRQRPDRSARQRAIEAYEGAGRRRRPTR